MQYPLDKNGRSVKQLALLKWFVKESYVSLPGEAVRRYAVAIYDRMSQETSQPQPQSQRS